MQDTPDRVDILIVDDQESNLTGLEVILEPLGQRLHRAQSGREALRMLLERDFAVILLDVKMPVLDGFETAKLIRERKRSAKTPIIFLTALAEERVQLFQAYSLGAVDYLVKPFEPSILQAKVSAFVELAIRSRQVIRAMETLREAESKEHERALLRKQMEAGLNQQRWLEAILDVMPTPLVLLDPVPPRVVFANRAARGLAGGALAVLGPPLEGVHFTDAAGRSLREEEMPAQRAVRGEKLAGVELDFAGIDFSGAVLTYSERLEASFGHAETVLLTMLDITELKIAEAGLRAALRAREDFLAVGSHELRTPLAALRIQMSNLMRPFTRPASGAPAEDAVISLRVVGQLRQMQASVERLTRLSDYLLDVTQLTAGNLMLSRAEMDLGDLAREVVERFEPERSQAGCEIRVVDAGHVTGRWDPSRIDQVITNLLANAIRYAPGKSVEIEVRSADRNAVLVVRDQGPGVPRERLPGLFQKFERAVEPEDRRGFGLGLWIVQEIVSMHGGTIEVESQQGVGTTFTLSLPREPLPAREDLETAGDSGVAER